MDHLNEIREAALAFQNRLNPRAIPMQQEADFRMAAARNIGTSQHDARRIVTAHGVQGYLYRRIQWRPLVFSRPGRRTVVRYVP